MESGGSLIALIVSVQPAADGNWYVIVGGLLPRHILFYVYGGARTEHSAAQSAAKVAIFSHRFSATSRYSGL
jgi:hypothetical protein